MTAQADHHLVFVSKIVKVSSTDCAVELTISGANQNNFQSDDRIDIGSSGTQLTPSFIAQINAAEGENDTGDTLLFASPSFVSAHGISADIEFEGDADCEGITSGTTVIFLNSGTIAIDSIDTSTVSGFGDTNTAITKSSHNGTPTLVNLSSATLQIKNNSGATVTLGTSNTTGGGTTTGSTSTSTSTTTSGASSSSGGCSLIRS